MRQHRFLQMTENSPGHISRKLPTPPRYAVIIKVGIAGTDRCQIGNRPPFPESCLGDIEIGPVVLTKQTFSLINRTGASTGSPFSPRLAVAIADALREADDTVSDAAVTAVVGMQIFKMLARAECAVVESAQASRGVVNNLVWKGMVRLGFGGEISEPGAQAVVNSGFTMSAKLFNIRVHSREKPPEGCEPYDGGFSMLDRRRELVNTLNGY
ncbi:hypothetical protein [Rhizobium rhizogenes]|uniref:hypothetical protein n=1 Tax=Rhizobium rhizogenes TaxID=359 RepID=UPI001574B558|nr:hypothetical protein [Rhizobium rhizogenes]NTF42593.1 hypothetical protein [Rhizobium rhizogenes]